MLVLGKRKAPGSAVAFRADLQDVDFTDNAKTFPSLARSSRSHRGAAAVPVAGPTPPRTGDNLGTEGAWRPAAPQADGNRLSATLSGDRLTVTCGCGRYSLAAHKPAEPRDGLVRCLICGARAGLVDLLADDRARRDHRSDTE